MSKKLNEAAMQSELSGSAFFREEPPERSTEAPKEGSTSHAGHHEAGKEAKKETVTPRHRGPTTPQIQDEEIIETIRRAVHQLGKEDATYRFTEAEKKDLADVVYTYGSAGIKTSQNEVTRIAINWLMEDYRANGKTSVLARVLERLNA